MLILNRCNLGRSVSSLLVSSIVLFSAPALAGNQTGVETGSSAPDSSAVRATGNSGSSNRPYWRTNLFGRFFRDQKYLFTSWWPAEIRRPGFTAPLVGGIAFASTSDWSNGEGPDLELEEYIQNESRGRAKGPARVFTDIGDGLAGAVLIGSGYLIGRWSGHERLAEASSLSAEALLSAGVWSTALKAIAVRARPGNESRGEFFDRDAPPGQSVDSFPSGHATGAFAIATVVSGVYRDSRWIRWVAYGTAGLVGYSRIALGRHFPSDVFVGGLLGNSLGRMVLAHREEPRMSASTFRPFFDPARQTVGVAWSRTWFK